MMAERSVSQALTALSAALHAEFGVRGLSVHIFIAERPAPLDLVFPEAAHC